MENSSEADYILTLNNYFIKTTLLFFSLIGSPHSRSKPFIWFQKGYSLILSQSRFSILLEKSAIF